MSSSSSSDSISSFLQSDDFKSYMQSAIHEALATHVARDQGPEIRDRQVAPPTVTELYTPSAHEIKLCPELGGEQDFFQGGLPSEEWVDKLRQHPKNTLLHQVLSADDISEDELRNLLVTFARFMRGRLAAVAGTINDARIEAIRKEKKLQPASPSKSLLDPSAFNEEIKVSRALAAAFAPMDKDNNNRGKSGKQDQQSRKRQDKDGSKSKGWNSDYRNADKRGDDYRDDNGRGRRQSSFSRDKDKETRRRSRSRDSSKSHGRSDRQ
ncbi:hypothetical protein BGZ98_003705 [Dissophora globulifera]|nr:hypothetical protein BGZ98_003705 [Dissophora globulifera]